MNIKEAVEKRILELCNGRNIAINALANISGVSPSTVYSMLNQKSQNPGVESIKKICDGLEISIREFFDSDLFDDLEQKSCLMQPKSLAVNSLNIWLQLQRHSNSLILFKFMMHQVLRYSSLF